MPATSLKKRLWYRCFPVNFSEISKSTFFIEHLWATASVLVMKDEMVTTNNGNNLSLFCDYSAFVVLVYVVKLAIRFIEHIYFLEQFLLVWYNATIFYSY